MSVFNFMETFFFISLGITFILILLLVYHFKQRLGAIEQKSDTMFDIMNNMVKEMGTIKFMALAKQSNMPFFPVSAQQGPVDGIFSQYASAGVPQYTEPIQSSVPEHITNTIQEIDLNETEMVDISLRENVGKNMEGDDDDEDDVSDDDDEDDGSDDDDDDDDDDDGSDDEDMVTELVETDLSVEQNTSKIVVSDDENVVDIDELLSVEPTIEDEITKEPTEKLVEEPAKQKTDMIVVEDMSEQTVADLLVETLAGLDVEQVVMEEEKDDAEGYRKMTPGALKAVVLAKGLSTDPSKMKKPQLLQLLGVSK